MPDSASENRLILVDTSVWIDHLKKSTTLYDVSQRFGKN